MLKSGIESEIEISLEDIHLDFQETAYAEISTAIQSPEDLANPAMIDSLREIITNYKTEQKIDHLRHGLRFILEFPICWPTKLFITTQPVAAQNFTDWLKPKFPWQPGLAKSQGGFFERCADSALLANPPLINDAPIEFLNPSDRTIFAVNDGKPKSVGHYIVLASEPRANLFDQNFSNEEWHKAFGLAYKLFLDKATNDQQLRIVANIGQDYQRGERFNLHVQWDNEFMSFNPVDYGFDVDQEKYMVTDSSSPEIYQTLVETIKAYDQAQSRAEKIELYQELKRFLFSRDNFH